MKIRLGILMVTALGLPAAFGAAAAAPPAAGAASKATSDLMPVGRRQASVEIAERLARPPAPAPVPADLPQPFNPAVFDQPDPADTTQTKTQTQTQNQTQTQTQAQNAPPPGDRDILEALAARIPTTGTIMMGVKPLLIVGKNRIEIGQDFVVTYNNQEYELKLVSIDRTTFTLRMRGEEITRPIKLVKAK